MLSFVIQTLAQTCDEKKKCADSHPQCVEWAHIGECIANPNFMTKNCPLSCKLCQPTNCVDQTQNCPDEHTDACYTLFAMQNCRYSCVLCNVQSTKLCNRPLHFLPAVSKDGIESVFSNIVQTFSDSLSHSMHIHSYSPWIITISDFVDDDTINFLKSLSTPWLPFPWLWPWLPFPFPWLWPWLPFPLPFPWLLFPWPSF